MSLLTGEKFFIVSVDPTAALFWVSQPNQVAEHAGHATSVHFSIHFVVELEERVVLRKAGIFVDLAEAQGLSNSAGYFWFLCDD